MLSNARDFCHFAIPAAGGDNSVLRCYLASDSRVQFMTACSAMADCEEADANAEDVANGCQNAASGDGGKSTVVVKVDRPAKVVGAMESYVHFHVHTVVRIAQFALHVILHSTPLVCKDF